MILIQTAFDQEYQSVLKAGQAHSLPPNRDQASLNIAGRECLVIKSGMGPQAARQSIRRTLQRWPGALPELVISIGLAGGLNPQLQFAHRSLISRVTTHSATHAQSASEQSTQSPKESLTESLNQSPAQSSAETPTLSPQSAAADTWLTPSLDRLDPNLIASLSVGTLVTLKQAAWSADSKRRLWQQTQADLCDMETHAVAQACVDHNVPWVGGRVVSDAADQTLQPWMLALPSLIQQARWTRLCRQLLTHPQDLPGLLRLALRMQQLKRHLTLFTIELVTHVLPA